MANAPKVPTFSPSRDGAVRLRGVLVEGDSVLVGDRRQLAHPRGVPVEVHGHDALGRSVIAASTAAGSRLKVPGSMSANTGVAPVSATELPVAAKVNDGTMTSSPGPTPAASRPR